MDLSFVEIFVEIQWKNIQYVSTHDVSTANELHNMNIFFWPQIGRCHKVAVTRGSAPYYIIRHTTYISLTGKSLVLWVGLLVEMVDNNNNNI